MLLAAATRVVTILEEMMVEEEMLVPERVFCLRYSGCKVNTEHGRVRGATTEVIVLRIFSKSGIF